MRSLIGKRVRVVVKECGYNKEIYTSIFRGILESYDNHNIYLVLDDTLIKKISKNNINGDVIEINKNEIPYIYESPNFIYFGDVQKLLEKSCDPLENSIFNLMREHNMRQKLSKIMSLILLLIFIGVNGQNDRKSEYIKSVTRHNITYITFSPYSLSIAYKGIGIQYHTRPVLNLPQHPVSAIFALEYGEYGNINESISKYGFGFSVVVDGFSFNPIVYYNEFDNATGEKISLNIDIQVIIKNNVYFTGGFNPINDEIKLGIGYGF